MTREAARISECRFARGALVILSMMSTALPAESSGPYAGSGTCRTCHAAQYAAWRESHHYQAMLPADETTVLGDFDDATFRYDGREHRFFRREGRYLVETDDADGNLSEFEVAYTFGFEPLQQYLIAFPGGHYQALNIVWDARPAEAGGQRWYHLYPADGAQGAVGHDDPLHWTGAFQNWNSRCAACHSTGLEKAYNPADGTYDTVWREINVACEACHGPGAPHVAWAADPQGPDPGFAEALPAAGNWQADSSRPVLLDGAVPKVTVGACAGCHSRRAELGPARPGADFADRHQLALIEDGLYHADGQIRDEVYVHGSFLQSRMHAAGVTCVDCHEPHSGRPRSEGNALCGRCHLPEVFNRPDHHRHRAGGPGSGCVDCHMPETVYMGVDARRDHAFRVPEPALTLSLGVPNACNRCHTDRDAEWARARLDEWHPNRRTRVAHAPVFAAARENRADSLPRLLAIAGDSSVPAILRATALSESARFPSAEGIGAATRALRSNDPLLRAAAARALAALPAVERFRLLSDLIDDPVLGVRTEVAIQLADVPPDEPPEPARSRLERLREEYLDTLRFTADMPEGLLNLGNFLVRSHRPEAAERAYHQALGLSPSFVPALVNLADLYRAGGLDAAAEPLLQRALTAAPGHAGALHALGLLRVRQGRLDEAVARLGEAAEHEPRSARYAYVYGVALFEAGRPDDARAVLRDALRRHPGDPDIRAALAAYRAATAEE